MKPSLFLKTLTLALLFSALPCLLQAQLNVTITPTHVKCFGAANGEAKANPTGGVPPYTYAWSNNSTEQSILNLAPGTYSVTVKDANLSSKTAVTTINQPPVLGVTAFGTSTICEVAPDGTAAAVPFGGTPAYHYLWNNSETTPSIQQLSGGTYTVTVTDAYNCTATGTTVVNSWGEGLWTMATATPATCAYNDGAAHISIMSGTAPYQYLWSNGGTDADINQLSAGTYTVTVSDVNGCATNTQVIVSSNPLLSIHVQLPDPLCLQPDAQFIANLPPPIYPEIVWSLSDPSDQIVSGQGTDTLLVHWGSTGQRSVSYQYGANGVLCGLVSYGLNVVVCAGTSEAGWSSGAQVSPNPFSESIQIQVPAGFPNDAVLQLTDATGKIWLEKDLRGALTSLSTETLPGGFYVLKISSNGAERVWKLTKQ